MTETDERRHEYGLCESCFQPVRLDRFGHCKTHKAYRLLSPWALARVTCAGSGHIPKPWDGE